MLQHESEILPFPNTEKSFSLPDDIIQDVKEGESVAVILSVYWSMSFFVVSCPLICVCVGKLGSEEETKEEFKMEREPPATHEEGIAALTTPPQSLV